MGMEIREKKEGKEKLEEKVKKTFRELEGKQIRGVERLVGQLSWLFFRNRTK